MKNEKNSVYQKELSWPKPHVTIFEAATRMRMRMTARRNHGGRLRSSSGSVIAHGRFGRVTSAVGVEASTSWGAGRSSVELVSFASGDGGLPVLLGSSFTGAVLSALDPVRAGLWA